MASPLMSYFPPLKPSFLPMALPLFKKMQPANLQGERSPARTCSPGKGHPAGEWLVSDSRAWPSQVLDMKLQGWIPLPGFRLLQC